MCSSLGGERVGQGFVGYRIDDRAEQGDGGGGTRSRFVQIGVEVECAIEFQLQRMHAPAGITVSFQNMAAGIGGIRRRRDSMPLRDCLHPCTETRRGRSAEPVADDQPRGGLGGAERRHRMHIEEHRHAEPRARRRQRLAERQMIGAMIRVDSRGDVLRREPPAPQLPQRTDSARHQSQPAAHFGGKRAAEQLRARVDLGIAIMLGTVEVDPGAGAGGDEQGFLAPGLTRDRVDVAIFQGPQGLGRYPQRIDQRLGIVSPAMRRREHHRAFRGYGSVSVEAGAASHVVRLGFGTLAGNAVTSPRWKILRAWLIRTARLVSSGVKMIRILLAEDDRVMREYLTRALERSGYAVSAVDRGTAAVPLLEAERFDLLLTDIVMPEMDGIELAQRAAEIAPDMRVMFITGFAAVTLRAGKQVPQARVLSKPFHLRDLVLEVDRMFESENVGQN